jgi:hypothetical protein
MASRPTKVDEDTLWRTHSCEGLFNRIGNIVLARVQ